MKRKRELMMNLRRPSVRVIGPMSVCAVFVLMVGCANSNGTAGSGSTDRTAPAVTSTPPDPATTAETPTGAAVESSPEPSEPDSDVLDVCALLTNDEIVVHLPGADPGASVGPTSCEWRDPATQESITLTIGDEATAADGQLPDPSDYGDTEPVAEMGATARYVSGFNVVEFAAGGRLCEIQVISNADQRTPAVALATLVTLRVSEQ